MNIHGGWNVGIIPLVVGITLSTSAFAQMEIKTATDTGRPSFVTGNLGNATAGAEVQALKQILASNPSYKSTGSEEFEVSRQWVDELGKSTRFLIRKLMALKSMATVLLCTQKPAITLTAC